MAEEENSKITKNLSIPIVQGTDLVAKESINNAIDAIDKNALHKKHADSPAHWAIFEKNTAYKKQDVFRTEKMPSWGFWEVTKAGTSDETPPSGSGEGDKSTTGTVEVVLRRLTGSSTGVKPWDSSTSSYKGGESLVTYDNALYICLTTHTPSKSFEDDFELGYWKRLDTDINAISDTGYYQIKKSNVVATYTFDLPIKKTDTFLLPPVEVLRLQEEGLTNVDETKYNMTKSDAYDFSYNKEYMAFGDDLKPITGYELKISPPTPITDGTNIGYISETEYIDFSKYTNVSSINI